MMMVSLLEDNSLGDTSLNPYLQILSNGEGFGQRRLGDDMGNVTIEHVDVSRIADDFVLDKNFFMHDDDKFDIGIEAGDVNSLLEQFEESEVSQTGTDDVTPGTPVIPTSPTNNNLSKRDADADSRKCEKEQYSSMSIEEIAKKILPVKRKSTILLENVTVPLKRNRKPSNQVAFRAISSPPSSLPCSQPNSLPNSAPSSPACQQSSCNSSRSCSPVQQWNALLMDHDYCYSPKVYQPINSVDPQSPMSVVNKENGEVSDPSTHKKKEEKRSELYMGKYKIKKQDQRHRHHHHHHHHHHRNTHHNGSQAVKDARLMSNHNSPVPAFTGNVQRELDVMYQKAREEFQKKFGKLEVPSIPEKKILRIQSLNEPPTSLQQKLDNSTEKPADGIIEDNPKQNGNVCEEQTDINFSNASIINSLIEGLKRNRKVEPLNDSEAHPTEAQFDDPEVKEIKEPEVKEIIELEVKEVREPEIKEPEIKEIREPEVNKTKESEVKEDKKQEVIEVNIFREKEVKEIREPKISEVDLLSDREVDTTSDLEVPEVKENPEERTTAINVSDCEQSMYSTDTEQVRLFAATNSRDLEKPIDQQIMERPSSPVQQLEVSKTKEIYLGSDLSEECGLPEDDRTEKPELQSAAESMDSKPVEITVNVDIKDGLHLELSDMDTDVVEKVNQLKEDIISIIKDGHMRNKSSTDQSPKPMCPDEEDSGEIESTDENDDGCKDDEDVERRGERSYSPYMRGSSRPMLRRSSLSRSRSRSFTKCRSRSHSYERSQRRSPSSRSQRSLSKRSCSRSRSQRSRSRRSRSRRSRSRKSHSQKSRSRSHSSFQSRRKRENSRMRSRYRRSSHSSCSISSRSSSRSSRRGKSRSISCSTCSSRSPSRSRSRSFSRSPSRKRSLYSRSRSRSRSRHRSLERGRRYLRDRSVSRERQLEMKKRQEKEWEDRRVLYIGNIKEGTTRRVINSRFSKFGNITRITLHFREEGDNYCFVTFAYTCDAYAAVEFGNEDPSYPKYDICFGGRRSFCRTSYADLDNMHKEEDELKFGYNGEGGSSRKNSSAKETDFDALLKQALKKVNHR